MTQQLAQFYPDACSDCGSPVCTCPPILPGTLGRIAHEIPKDFRNFIPGGALLSPEEASEAFELGVETVRIAATTIPVDVNLIRDIHRGVTDLRYFAVKSEEVAGAHSVDLAKAIAKIEDLTSAQRITQEGMDALASAIAALPPEPRNALIGFLTGLGSSIWATALVQAVQGLIR